MTKEILYCHVEDNSDLIANGHWFFNTASFNVCAEMNLIDDENWKLLLHYKPLGSQQNKDLMIFQTKSEAIEYVQSIFELKVREVLPSDLPSPDDL